MATVGIVYDSYIWNTNLSGILFDEIHQFELLIVCHDLFGNLSISEKWK